MVVAAFLVLTRAEARPPSVAFFYGKPVPVAELKTFDWVVVEPENVHDLEVAELQRAGVRVFAYLSLGEAAPGSVDPRWTLGRNEAWSNVILDPAAEGWRERVLGRVDALRARGYRGLFLDTLDSYAIALRTPESRRAAAAALASLVRAIHERHRDVELFFNRGFELLDDVGDLASGVAAESLLFGWDAASKRYVEVPAPDSEWLSGRLRMVARQLGIPVVVVDYLPPSRREEAREAARRIQAMGFVPWISTPAFDVIGVGASEHAP